MLAATIDIIDTPDSSDRRSGEPRVAVDRPSTLRAPERPPLDVMVEDLSVQGFRFASDARLPLGAVVRVGLAGAGVEEARIVRRDAVSYGCAFVRPLSAARMAIAFSAAGVVQGPFAAPATAISAQPEKWPASVRLGVLIGSSVALWAGVLSVAGLLLG